MGKVVGIDLGTTFSAIAHVNVNGATEPIPIKKVVMQYLLSEIV